MSVRPRLSERTYEQIRSLDRRQLVRASALLGSVFALEKLAGCADPERLAPALAAAPDTMPSTAPVGVAGMLAPEPAVSSDVHTPARNEGPTRVPAGAKPGMPTPDHEPRRVACASAVVFPMIRDDAPRATFARMDQGSALEWLTTGVSAALYAAQLPDSVLFMLRALDEVYVGYPISVLSHSLQAASRARAANAPDELVLCALCHHLGALLIWEGHEELSAAILRGFVSEDAYRVVRHQAEYQLAHTGAALGQETNLRARYAGQSWHASALRFCDEWDSPSYDASYPSLTLADFEPLVRATLGPESGYLVGERTSTDCFNGGT